MQAIGAFIQRCQMFPNDTPWVLLKSEESRQRGLYPYHIEPLATFNQRGPGPMSWHPVLEGTSKECWGKLYELPPAKSVFDDDYPNPTARPMPTASPALPAPPAAPKPLKSRRHTKAGYVYFLKAGDLYKIGKSTRLPTARTAEYSPKLPFETTLVKVIEAENCHRMESSLHNRFKSKHVRGEWYALTDEDLGQL
jgi:hypothetical protein